MSKNAFLCFFCGTIVLVGLVFRADHREQLAKQRELLLQIEVNVLQDQLADTVAQVSQRPTYADGLRDGVENSKNSSWVDGYHSGISQTLEQAKMSEALSKSESNE